VRGLYESRARPLTIIVHGLQTSWDPSIATMQFPDGVDDVAWSPCSRFIAISWGEHPPRVEILDAATLMRLTVLEFPMGDLDHTNWLIFSPDGRLLTSFVYCEVGGKLISWDLQTGVVVSAISAEEERNYRSIAYSACGTIFGFLSHGSDVTVNTYNVLSGTHICSHLVEGLVKGEIWAHGECLRFTTVTPESITTWEAGFASTHAPTKVETLPIPDGCRDPEFILVHPTLPRLAFICEQRVRVWDTQHSKFLLDSAHEVFDDMMSFSPDGRFFTSNGATPEGIFAGIYLWKESHTGYVLHQRLISDFSNTLPRISPNGRSVIAFGGPIIQLWHTMESATSRSTVSAQTSRSNGRDSVFGFSPDEALAAVVRDKTITVVDLKSGVPRLTIDAGMEVYGLGVTGSNIVAIGEGEIVTWDLPAGDHVLDLRANITDSIWTVPLDNHRHDLGRPESVILSPDLHHVAIVRSASFNSSYLSLYHTHTGQHLQTVTRDHLIYAPWFTPEGREIWFRSDVGGLDGWKIVEDSKSDVTGLEHLGSTEHRPDGPPSPSSRGYQIRDDEWILSPSGKRLFWLLPKWRSRVWQRRWGGRFLALLHEELPEAVILELE